MMTTVQCAMSAIITGVARVAPSVAGGDTHRVLPLLFWRGSTLFLFMTLGTLDYSPWSAMECSSESLSSFVATTTSVLVFLRLRRRLASGADMNTNC